MQDKSRWPRIDVLSQGAWELLKESETAKQRNNVSLSYLGRDSEWKTKLLYTLALGPLLALSR